MRNKKGKIFAIFFIIIGSAATLIGILIFILSIQMLLESGSQSDRIAPLIFIVLVLLFVLFIGQESIS